MFYIRVVLPLIRYPENEAKQRSTLLRASLRFSAHHLSYMYSKVKQKDCMLKVSSTSHRNTRRASDLKLAFNQREYGAKRTLSAQPRIGTDDGSGGN